MGEPLTYQPEIELRRDDGVISFTVFTEGHSSSFDIDVDDADRIIRRLTLLKERYYEETP